MRIQHNIPAMSSYRNYTNNVSALSKNLERLSSGYKINRAGDDAAGLAISEKMRAQITGLEVAQKNAKDGISLVQTAEGALTEVHDMLNRMYELAEQSANGTYADEVDREQLQKEIVQLRTEIDRIADSSNFNGINLLDGSLSSASKATKIDIGKIAATKSAGQKGVYESSAAWGYNMTSAAQWKDGDTFSYTVSLEDGTSYTAKFTLDKKNTNDIADIGKWKFVSEDGDEYPVGNTSGADIPGMTAGIIAELNKTGLAKSYTISTGSGDGIIKLEALKEGSGVSRVGAIDYRVTYGTVDVDSTALGVANKTQARDEGFEILADNITEYDGSNYDEAMFTINGKKFVLLTETLDAKTTGPNKEYLHATEGLGSDVTVLIGGRGGLKAGGTGAPTPGDTDPANNNFNQNIKKIADATGLTVTQNLAADGTPTGTTGIRLSIGKGTSDQSLVLQIGDTAEDFNQLKVSINDCHADAIGVGSIDISSQKGASDAMAKIKDAINYVSDVRGTLGATQNRLDHTINNLSVMQENIQDAESTIRDVDVAAEMMNYTKNNILVQSAQAMLAQANQLPQGVLQLLQ